MRPIRGPGIWSPRALIGFRREVRQRLAQPWANEKPPFEGRVGGKCVALVTQVKVRSQWGIRGLFGARVASAAGLGGRWSLPEVFVLGKSVEETKCGSCVCVREDVQFR